MNTIKRFLELRLGFSVITFLFTMLLLAFSMSDVGAGNPLINLKLSGTIPETADVGTTKLSPDGQTVVFLADIITDDAFELYSVPVDGSAEPTLLSSGLLPSGTEVEAFQISPDNNWVVYVAEQDITNVPELFSVPITGGTITKLNPPITAVEGEVESCCFEISADSSRVVFMADWQIYNHHELFSTPIAGGEPTKLNEDLPADGKVIYFQLSPDGSRAIYLVQQNAVSPMELFAVPVTGGDSYKLNDPLVAGGNVLNFEISPDSSRVVYVADQDTQFVDELYSVSLMNPAADAIKLNPVMVANGDVAYIKFEISPDSSRVAYIADQDVDTMNELYVVPIDGGTAVKLNEPLAQSIDSGTCRYLDCFRFSPDSNYVVYTANQDTVNIREIYSAHITETGSVVAKLNDTITVVGRNIDSFEISPDGSRVVYNGNLTAGVNEELFSVPIEGGVIAKLNSALVAGGSVITYAISHDSQRVIYVAIQQTAGVSEIYSVPLADGPVTKLNPPLVDGGAVYLNFEIAPDNNHIVYRAEQETDNVAELFVSFEEVPETEYVIFLPAIIK